MAFQLSVRDNRQAGDFGQKAHDTFTFEEAPITIGASDKCSYRVDDTTLPAEIFQLQNGNESGTCTLTVSEQNVTVYVNNEPVKDAIPLINGDEIRCGHWTFRFFRLHSLAGYSTKADALSLFTKVFVALIFVGQAVFVIWLPRQLYAAELWQEQIVEQKVARLIEKLQGQAAPGRTSDPKKSAALQLVQKALREKATFIQQHRGELPQEKWELIRDDLVTYRDMIHQIESGNLTQPQPSLNIEQAAKKLLEQNEQQQ